MSYSIVIQQENKRIEKEIKDLKELEQLLIEYSNYTKVEVKNLKRDKTIKKRSQRNKIYF